MKPYRRLVADPPSRRYGGTGRDALEAEVDALKRLQAETDAEFEALLPAILDRAPLAGDGQPGGT